MQNRIAMQKRFLLLFICIFGQQFNALAQKSAINNDELKDYNRAVELYKDRQYMSAQIIFEQVRPQIHSVEVAADCQYYIANCAVRLNQSGADVLMENFVADNPTSPKTNEAYQEVAQYYFDQANYQKSLEWFEKVDETAVDDNDLDKFNFQKGYCYFATKNKKVAANYFNQVSNSPNYGSQAKYYLGYMAYESDDYNEASKQFEKVDDQKKYKEKMSYFQADMNFKLGNFQKAIDFGQTAMAKANATEKSDLNKIIGESYFNLKQYDKAIPFLEQFQGRKGKWSNTDYYNLGYCFYKTNDYEKAITQFNKIIDGMDFVAQNAFYHLGESYLKTDKKQQALNAFKNASEMTADSKIQEDAYYNYAKLSYDIGNAYQTVPDVLNGFLEKYPSNLHKTEIDGLLINAYITSKNYKSALAILEKYNTSPAQKGAYQKVTYYRGLEFFAEGNYKESLAIFKKSIATPKDPKFVAKAQFWKAESEYNLDQFENATVSYNDFANNPEAKNTSDFKNLDYNRGYCAFKLKQYDKAVEYFGAYTTAGKDDKVRLNDAYLRLGDAQFVLQKYWLAIESYNKSIEMKNIDLDYASFQRNICYGFVNKNDKKIELLKQFIVQFPKSQYKDDAYFELGNTYVTESKTADAIATYQEYLKENPTGIYASKAILKQGLVYYNEDKDEQALERLKKVTTDFPNSPEAIEAVETVRLIYLDSGRVEEYTEWVKTLKFIEITDVELEKDTYNSAEKQYLQNNSNAAISGFKNYVNRFPNGANALKANYYLAQLQYNAGNEKAAVPNYEFVINQPKNEFTEPSLVRLAQTYLKENNLDKAIIVLKRLETEADFPQNITYAQANLMKSYYEKEDYPNTVLAAEKVMANPKIDAKVRSDAQIMIARSAIKTGDEAKARTSYNKLLATAKGALAAETLYYDAYFKNKDNKFEASNQSIQKLSKNYSSYKYYCAKALVVMAKNFYGQKDAYQANYILESVIKNFAEFTDVVEEATTEQNKIKEEQAKTNSSVRK